MKRLITLIAVVLACSSADARPSTVARLGSLAKSSMVSSGARSVGQAVISSRSGTCK